MTKTRSTSSKKPIVFDDFFDSGLEERVSPFLTPESRQWAENLQLKSSFLSATLLVTSFSLSFFPHAQPLAYFLLVFVYFLAGVPALISSLEDLSTLEVNIDALMVLAAFSSILIGSPMEGALLLVLFDLSGTMEEAVTAKAKGAISSLYKLSPTKAWVFEADGTLLERSVKDVAVGEYILVKAGEVIPLDGTITEGASSLNLVHLTGENLPITKKEGDEVPAGARNLEGSLKVQVSRPSSDSTVARIINLVTQAHEARPRWQQWFDQVSKPYATTIILLSFFFALTLPLVFSMPYFGYEGSFYRAIAFLIAASPCALIIAMPTAYLSALSACARKGILLKGGVILDALSSCSAVAFDKTGTLTTGNLSIVSISPLQEEDEHLLPTALQAAVALEQHAVHPIARAIMAYAEENAIKPVPIKDFKAVYGYGIEALASMQDDQAMIYLGNPDYILPKVDEPTAALLKEKMEEVRRAGDVLALMLWKEKIFIFRMEDTLRPKIKETIQEMKRKKKWQLIMLTGDHPEGAKKIATQLGIDEYFAELKPEDKLCVVTDLANEKGLAMIGDGINDAPALARATVGICMGKVGSTTAIEAADVVLLHDNLEFLDWLMDKAKKTKQIVNQNLTLAFAVILLATTPALLGWVPLWLAVILHEGGTVLVGLNALRLLR